MQKIEEIGKEVGRVFDSFQIEYTKEFSVNEQGGPEVVFKSKNDYFRNGDEPGKMFLVVSGFPQMSLGATGIETIYKYHLFGSVFIFSGRMNQLFAGTIKEFATNHRDLEIQLKENGFIIHIDGDKVDEFSVANVTRYFFKEIFNKELQEMYTTFLITNMVF